MTNLTQNKITFLSDIDRSYRVNKSEKYFYYPLGNVRSTRYKKNRRFNNIFSKLDYLHSLAYNIFLSFLNNLTITLKFSY